MDKLVDKATKEALGKDYYIQPTWDLHQSELSKDSVDKYNLKNSSGFKNYDEAMEYAFK